jgi:hypothetical protein
MTDNMCLSLCNTDNNRLQKKSIISTPKHVYLEHKKERLHAASKSKPTHNQPHSTSATKHYARRYVKEAKLSQNTYMLLVFALEALGTYPLCPRANRPCLQANGGTDPQIRPRPLPSISFPIQYPLIILSFDAISSELLTASLNKHVFKNGRPYLKKLRVL